MTLAGHTICGEYHVFFSFDVYLRNFNGLFIFM